MDDVSETMALVSTGKEEVQPQEARVLPPAQMSTSPLETMGGLALDPGEHLKPLDQATLFRSIDAGNTNGVKAILNTRSVDVNAYNDEGVTALFLAVYYFERHRDVAMIELLLAHGARATTKAATPPSVHKISVQRHDAHRPDVLLETRKLSLDHKIPLLVALELKSALYVRGWEYRHWDPVLEALSAATVAELEGEVAERGPPRSHAYSTALLQKAWGAVWASGGHDVVEVSAEGTYMQVLKQLLVHGSKTLRFNIEPATALMAERLELKEASAPVARAMMGFLYTGLVDPPFMETRGVDLYNAASKYGVEALQHLCEKEIVINPENWIKVLTAAVNSDSDVLSLSVAKSVHGAMHKRAEMHAPAPSQSFSHDIHPDGGPEQLFPPHTKAT